jgi:hypothetical protein
MSIVSPVCITFANAGFSSEHAENHKSDAAVMFTRRVPTEGLTDVVFALDTGLVGGGIFAAAACAGATVCAGTTGGITLAIVGASAGAGVGLAATAGAGTTGICVASGFIATGAVRLLVGATEVAGAVAGTPADVGNIADVGVAAVVDTGVDVGDDVFADSATEGIVSGAASRCTL